MLGGIVIHTISDRKLLMLRPSQIRIPLKRQVDTQSDEAIGNLTASIAVNGVIEPVTVRKREDGGYELISGLRRLCSAKKAGLRRIPCVVHKADSYTAELYSVIENLQRKQPSFFDEAAAIKRIIESYDVSEKELAVRLGIPQHILLSKLSLLKLSERHRERIINAGITECQARALLHLDEAKRELAIEKIISEGLGDKQTERLAADIYSGKFEKKPEPEKPKMKYAIGDIRLFSNSLSKMLSTLQNAGIDAALRKYENNKYVEFRIKIKKEVPEEDVATQLKIC